MNSEQLKMQLRYMGKQYQSGQVARGGSGEPHYLTQAADLIETLEQHIESLPKLEAPVKELEGTYPVVLYFGNDADREGFIKIAAEAIPNAVFKKL